LIYICRVFNSFNNSPAAVAVRPINISGDIRKSRLSSILLE